MLHKLFQRAHTLMANIEASARNTAQLLRAAHQMREALGRIESRQSAQTGATSLQANEFQVYSQWGEDGILQFLIRHVPISQPIFVEFGVETYTEANTRFLLVNNNWSGLIMDGNGTHVRAVKKEPLYWRHNLKAVEAFITRENINSLLAENGLSGEIGLLSIDVDGNDYWIWEAIHGVRAAIVVVEYNARFGPQQAVTVPYDPAFERAKAHPSMIYYGASLAALVYLAQHKGYAFVGSNSAGNNAFFVRRDLLAPPLQEVTAAEGYRPCRFREARDAGGKLLFWSPEEEQRVLQQLPLVQVVS